MTVATHSSFFSENFKTIILLGLQLGVKFNYTHIYGQRCIELSPQCYNTRFYEISCNYATL